LYASCEAILDISFCCSSPSAPLAQHLWKNKAKDIHWKFDKMLMSYPHRSTWLPHISLKANVADHIANHLQTIFEKAFQSHFLQRSMACYDYSEMQHFLPVCMSQIGSFKSVLILLPATNQFASRLVHWAQQQFTSSVQSPAQQGQSMQE
jgi:hypothetical protein